MNWGTGIASLYIGFIALIGVMVTMSFNQKIDLVNEKYYEKELAFQQQINAMENAKNIAEQITHEMNAGSLNLQFPAEVGNKDSEGTIVFFRPSDATKDYECPLQLNSSNVQSISLKNLSPGMYKMQISWTRNQTPFYVEQVIVIPQ
jgi:nitrogen fixation protein FixH